MKIMIVNSETKQKTQNNFGNDQKSSSLLLHILYEKVSHTCNMSTG